MICPKCANDKTYVLDTHKSGPIVIRARRCPICHFVFETREVPQLDLFTEEEKKEYEEYIAEESIESKE